MPELDLEDVAARLGAAGVSELRPLAGGASSLTYEAQSAGRRVVVKVAPPGLTPTRDRDVLRQARVIRLLESTPVPVPEVVWEDPGDPPAVPPLFVMSFVEGTATEPLFDREADATPEIMAERMRDAARTMAALHGLRPDGPELAGESFSGPEEEIDRWSRLLETVDQSHVAGWERVGAVLRGSVPAPLSPALVHGDFRLGNLLAVGARIEAVVDWEIWSVGDPRVDAGWFLLNADPATYGRATPYAGLTPPVADLTTLYVGTLGRSVPDLPWFQALAAFKSTATWSRIVKHNRRRRSPDDTLESMVPMLPRLLDRARELLA